MDQEAVAHVEQTIDHGHIMIDMERSNGCDDDGSNSLQLSYTPPARTWGGSWGDAFSVSSLPDYSIDGGDRGLSDLFKDATSEAAELDIFQDEVAGNSDETDDGNDEAEERQRGGLVQLCNPQAKTKCAGLRNLGNTCFLNAVLQCLTYTVPFANSVMNSRHKASCQTEGFCAMCALEEHIRAVVSSFGRTVAPFYFANNLTYISKSFVLGEQQDAHECFFFLIEVLQKCCIFGGSTPPLGQKSFVSDIFVGTLRSQVKCSYCSQSSDTVEDFLGLSLEIENCNTVVEALHNFTAVEMLEEDNKASCSHCKNLARRSKQLTFDKPPEVLAVHLKRFRASEIYLSKIEKDIEYGFSLDLKPFLSQGVNNESFQEGDFKYTLYAVLVHSGWSTTSGHYFCYIKTSPGLWHCMNDSMVSRVSEETVLQQEAYILFYIRQDLEDFPDELIPKHSQASCMEPSTITVNEPEIKPEEDTCSVPVVESTQPEINDDIICSQEKLSCHMPKSISKSKSDKDVYFNDMPVRVTLPMDQRPKSQASTVKATSSVVRCLDSQDKAEEFNSLERVQGVVFDSSRVKLKRSASPVEGPGFLQNGSGQSLMRLLNKMPSGRRNALLASAMPVREVASKGGCKRRPSEDDGKAGNTNAHQCGDTRPGKRQEKALSSSDDEPWIEEYNPPDSRKLQRGGGKRIMASCVDSCAKYHRRHREPAAANV